jgi:VWFA-related protein
MGELVMKKLVLLLAALTVVAAAADGGLVLVRFQVISKQGQPVTDLRPEDIEVREDGASRKLAMFEGGTTHPRTVPTEIAFMFDCSGTTFAAGALDPRVFHENLLDQNERAAVSIYGFSGGLVRLSALTRDPARLKKAMDSALFAHPSGTFLLEQIGLALSDVASSPGPAVRLLVVISDGQGDGATTSNAARQERYAATVQVAQNAGVSLYPVLLREPFGLQASARGATAAPSSSESQMTLRTVGDFTNLASATGGSKFEVLSGTGLLPGILKSIAGEIRNDYVAGFQPASSGQPKRRKIEVVLRDKNRGKLAGGERTLVH